MYHLKQRNDNTQVIRNALFREGQRLQREAINAFHQSRKSPTANNKMTLIRKIGMLAGYVQSRKSVSPYIAIDVALQEQEGLIRKVNHWVDENAV